MMRQIFKTALAVFFILLAAPGCTRVVAIASDKATEPVIKRFTGTPDFVYAQAVKVLDAMHYEMPIADYVQFKIVTGWKATGSGTHYLTIFNRPDYGAADGAYYQLMVDFVPEGLYTRAEVRTNVKSVAGKLASTKALEKDFLTRLEDALRSPQIQITNVGVHNR